MVGQDAPGRYLTIIDDYFLLCFCCQGTRFAPTLTYTSYAGSFWGMVGQDAPGRYLTIKLSIFLERKTYELLQYSEKNKEFLF